MATLIPAIGTSAFDSTGERRLAERLEQLLDADYLTSALTQRKLAHRVRKKSGDYQPGAVAVQVTTMKVSNGLAFPVVALPGEGHMPAAGEDDKEAARVICVAATRDTQSLLVTVSGDNGIGQALGATHLNHPTKGLHA